MQLAWFIGFLAVGGIAVATELRSSPPSSPLARGSLNSWRSCQASRITSEPYRRVCTLTRTDLIVAPRPTEAGR